MKTVVTFAVADSHLTQLQAYKGFRETRIRKIIPLKVSRVVAWSCCVGNRSTALFLCIWCLPLLPS